MKKYLLILFSLIVLACNNSHKQNGFKYTASVKQVEENLSYYDIFEEVKYIKLETQKECLLGEIKQALFSNLKIYLLTKNGVYCFSNEGKFLFSIDKKGKGPQEFIRIENMFLCDNKLCIYDNPLWRILTFNANTGAFISSPKLEYSVANIYAVDDYLIMDRLSIPNKYIKDDYRIIISKLNKTKKIINGYFTDKKYKFHRYNQFYGYNNQALFIEPFLTQAYKVYNNSLINYFRFDFVGHNLTENETSVILERRNITSSFPNKAVTLDNLYESPTLIFSQTILEQNTFNIIYNKQTNKAIIYDAFKLKSEYYQIKPYYIIGVSGEYFCGYFTSALANNIKEHIIKNKITFQKEDKEYANNEILMKTELNDNPIIVLYKFRNDFK